MKISLTSVFVESPVDAFRFYTGVLGFVEKVFMPEAQLAIVAAPDDPEGTSLLLEPNGNPIARTYQKGLYDEGLPCIVFGTEDLQADYERLKGRGVAFKKPPTRTEWGVEAIFDDTCGNLIQLHQV